MPDHGHHLLINIIQKIRLVIQCVCHLNDKVEGQPIGLVPIAFGYGLPPVGHPVNVFLRGLVFHVIRLIGQHWNDTAVQAVIDHPVQDRKELFVCIILHANTYMRDPHIPEILHNLPVIRLHALPGLAPIHIHSPAQKASIRPRVNGIVSFCRKRKTGQADQQYCRQQ